MSDEKTDRSHLRALYLLIFLSEFSYWSEQDFVEAVKLAKQETEKRFLTTPEEVSDALLKLSRFTEGGS